MGGPLEDLYSFLTIALCLESAVFVISILWMVGVCMINFHECVLHI